MRSREEKRGRRQPASCLRGLWGSGVLKHSLFATSGRRASNHLSILSAFIIGTLLVSVAHGTNRDPRLPSPTGKIEQAEGARLNFRYDGDDGNRRDNERSEVCITQSYAADGSETYYWPVPLTAHTELAMRFTTCDPMYLKTIKFFVFDPGNGTFGNNKIKVKIYTDVGGLPGMPLFSVDLLPSEYVAYPAVTTVDLSSSPLALIGDFHLAITSDAIVGSGDYESILSDDGSMGVGRSSYLQLGVWYRFESPSPDFNFLASVELCHECPVKNSGTVSSMTPSAANKGRNGVNANSELDSSSISNMMRRSAIAHPPLSYSIRALKLDRVWFRKDGDPFPWGAGEGFVRGAVSPEPPNIAWANYDQQFVFPEDDNDDFAFNYAKRKCFGYSCTSPNDGCRWHTINREIYRDESFGGGQWAGPNVRVRLRFDERDRAGERWASLGLQVIEAAAICAGAYLGAPLLGWSPCARAGVSAAYGLIDMLNDPSSTHLTRLGTSDAVLAFPPSPYCNNLPLDSTINGKDARIEYSWIYPAKKSGPAAVPEGNCWPDASPPSSGTPGLIDKLNKFCFAQVSGTELKFFAWVDGFSLRDPHPAQYNPPGLPWTREFLFAIDADGNPNTGDQTWPFCGADYYVSLKQLSDWVSISEKDSIYVWDTDCCNPVPTWLPVTSANSTPYDIGIGDFQVKGVAPFSAIGNPNGPISAWAILKVNGQIASTAPDQNPCTDRLPITTTLDSDCPRILSAGFSAVDGTYRVKFSEPVAALQASDIVLSRGSFTVSMDATSREAIVSGNPSFQPGFYMIQILGSVKDLSNNLLCEAPFEDEFCVSDDFFYSSNAAVVAKYEFAEAEIVYASGQGFPGSQFDLYLVRSDDTRLQGIKLIDQTTDGKNAVFASAGVLNAINLGAAVSDGEYTIVADLNQDGIFQYTDRAAGGCGSGLLVGEPCDEGLVDDIVAGWPLNEVTAAGGATDGEGQNYGIHVGGPTGVPGKVRGALNLDGIDDYVAIADNDALDFGASLGNNEGDFSIEAWIRSTKTTGDQVVLEKSSATTGYSFYLSNGRLAVRLADGTANSYVSSLSIADGSWHHVGVSVDRDIADGLRLFVDGALVGTFNPTAHVGALANSNELRIGSRSTAVADLFKGDIDEPTLYERALALVEFRLIWSNGSLGKSCVDTLMSCSADGDVNGDGIALTIADMIYLDDFISHDGPEPPLPFLADITGDCLLDTADVSLYQCYFAHGMSCFAQFPVPTCCDPDFVQISYVCGDANGTGIVSISDVVYLINYIFAGGPAPNPVLAGDTNCSGAVSISDAVYLINYIFAGGAAPCATCP